MPKDLSFYYFGKTIIITVRSIIYLLIFTCAFIASSCSSKEDKRSESKNQESKPEKVESIPSINIQTDAVIGWDAKQQCNAFYIENGDTTNISGKIKCRGGASSKYEKHSFSIEFDSDINLCGITSDDDWILNASYIDKTFQRHKLSYDLFREMSPNNIASKSAYIKVYVNDNYEGVYVVMEEINGSMLGLIKEDDQAMLFKDPLIYFNEILPNAQDPVNYFQQKFPKFNVVDKSDYMTQFSTFLFDSSDDDFDTEIATWIDIENVIDWHLILLFSNNEDGLFKNFYLYKLNASTPLRIAIWDYDHSFGRNGDYSYNMLLNLIDCKKIVLLRRLMESNTLNYNVKLADRWNELRGTKVFSEENLSEMIASNEVLLKPNLEQNFKRWPLNSRWYSDDNSYQKEIEIIKEYIGIRIRMLDKHFAN